jgi:AcrR family transcriptional regulator
MSEGRRGATRSQAARSAILAAAASMVQRSGYDRVTMEGIASEAGVGKQTIYRWWPSKSAVIAECLLEGALLPESFGPPDTGDIRADLTEWLRQVFDFVAVPDHKAMLRSLIAAAVDNPDVGEYLSDRLGASSDIVTPRLDAALAAGELRSDTSTQVLIDAVIGVIFSRLLLPTPARSDDARVFVDLIMHGCLR